MNNLAGSLVENFEKHSRHVCLIEGEWKLNYKELYEKVTAFRQVILDNGITRGSKVLVLVPMSIELYVTLISLWTVGAIPCFMDEGFIKKGMKNNDFDDIQAIVGVKKYLLYSYVNNYGTQFVSAFCSNLNSDKTKYVSGSCEYDVTYYSGLNASIFGGCCNIAFGENSTIVGGNCNKAAGCTSVIVGGRCSTSYDVYSVVTIGLMTEISVSHCFMISISYFGVSRET